MPGVVPQDRPRAGERAAAPKMRPLAVRCTVLATAIFLAAGSTGGDQSYGTRGGRVGLRCTLRVSGAPLLQVLGLRGAHSAARKAPGVVDGGELLGNGCLAGGRVLRGGYEPDVMSPCDVSALRELGEMIQQDPDHFLKPRPMFINNRTDESDDEDQRQQLASGLRPEDMPYKEDEWQEKDVGEYSSEEKKADDDSQKEEEGGAGGGGGSSSDTDWDEKCSWCNVKWLKDIKLLTAARHGDLEELEAALVNGADPDGRDQMHMNWTSLHHAAFYGHADVIERLIDAGAFVDPRDMANWTPLHHAALKGRTDATLALLSMGADALALTEFAKTPLQKAVYMCNTETVEVLCEFMGIPSTNLTGDEDEPDQEAIQAALDLQQQEEEDAASSDDRRGEAQVRRKTADGFGQEEVHQDDERTASEEVKVQEMKDEYRKQYNQLQEVQGFRKFA